MPNATKDELHAGDPVAYSVNAIKPLVLATKLIFYLYRMAYL
jgi:hypothetical protein